MNEIALYVDRAILPTVVALLAIATYSDCRWRLIKNVLTVPAIALGLLLHFLGSGWPGLTFAMLGLLAGFGLMLIPFTIGQMGGGDVKLMAALGSLLGAYAIINVFLYTTLAGGLLAMGFALYRKEGLATLGRTWHLAKGLFIFRTVPSMETNSCEAVTVPYGVAIAVGTLTYWTLGSVI